MSEDNKEDKPVEEVKGKPVYVTVRYNMHNSIIISELEREYNFEWSAVSDWWVKWDELVLIVQGNEQEGERQIVVALYTEECDVDMKHPSSITVYDDNFDPLEER